MEALRLVYEHWFITLLFLFFGAVPIAFALALGVTGMVVKLRGGKGTP